MSRLRNIIAEVTKLSQLRQLHAHLIHYSLHCQSYWAALLINQCTRLRAPRSYARCIFDSVCEPNVFVFTSMLKYYSQFGAQSDVLHLFAEMRKRNVKPDAFLYPIMIKTAGEHGIAFHAYVLKVGLDCDRIVRNAVMDMYGKFGPIEHARKLFDEMSERAVADWNSIISGYWKWRNDVEAKKLFDLMPDRNVITWTAMVTGYSRMEDLVSARRFFDQMPERNVVSWNAMISGYAQSGCSEEAMKLFADMVGAGVDPDETTLVTVISSCSSQGNPAFAEWLVRVIHEKGIRLNAFVKTALLDMYAKCGNLEMARKIFDEMGAQRNSVTWNAMISAYARNGNLSLAKELFDRMPMKNVVSWNSIISAFATNGQSKTAIDLFKEMIEKELVPDEVTMLSVISACGHLGALEFSKEVTDFLTKTQIKPNISCYNSLIFMYSKCGSMNDAKRTFQSMESRDVVSYNALITGFAAYGKGDEAIDLLQKMKAENIKPDRITYTGLLTACSHAGLVDEGQRIFDSIKAPEVDHYACMVDLLGRNGKLDEAKGLIERMPMHPHAGVYGALLNASRIHKRIDYGEFAAAKLFEIEPENAGNYILLSNLYASLRRWEDVERIRGLMGKERISKTTGCSWVEHRGQMHQFKVGDLSHEKSDEIYRVLRETEKKMRLTGYTADKSCVLRDIEEEEKEEMVGSHSEKLAVAFALLVSEPGSVIRVVKNLRICRDCHTAMKIISKLEKREIIVRDNNRFHCFSNGLCSCKDYW